MLNVLRENVRESVDRNTTPSASIIDSQTVKTTDRGEERGYDGGMGLILKIAKLG